MGIDFDSFLSLLKMSPVYVHKIELVQLDFAKTTHVIFLLKGYCHNILYEYL